MNTTSKFTASPFFVPKLMTFDYRLIDDAIRRLIDGSCCLTGEEQMAIADLFEKLRNAVLDHVGLEEEIVFPILEKDPPGINVAEFVGRMRQEHTQLSELLAAAKVELDDAHGIAFRAVLREFHAALGSHRKLELEIHFAKIVSDLGNERVVRVMERSLDGFIG